MQITLKLQKFIEVDGLKHTNTDYRMYSDKGKTTLVKEILDGPLVNVAIDVFVPVGATYYLEATRRFNLPNINYVSELYEYTNNDEEISNMIVKKPIVIERPIVNVNKSDIVDGDGDTFTVTTSSYRGEGDGHTHSNWFVYNKVGKLIHKVLLSPNKTSLDLPRSIGRDVGSLEFIVQHCSNNIVSPAGRKKILFDRVNFEITSKTTNVPIDNYYAKISKVDKTKRLRVNRVNVYDINNNLVKTSEITVDKDILTVMVDRVTIRDNIKLRLEVIGYTAQGKVESISTTITPITYTHSDTVDKSYKFSNTLAEGHDDAYLIPYDDISTDIVNGLNILPVGNKLKYYKYDYSVKKIVPMTELKGVTLINEDNDGIFIKYLDTGVLVVDTVDDDGKPTFLIYQHTIYKDTYVLKHSITRSIETKSLGYTNSVVQISREELMYAVVGTNKINKLNVTTGVITEVMTVGKGTNNTLINMLDGRILIFSNDTHMSQIYRYQTDTLIDGPSLPASELVKSDLKAVRLINGDWLIISNKVGVNKGVYFDSDDYTMTLLDLDFPENKGHSILPLSGEVALCKQLPTDGVNNLPVRTNIVRYQ